MAGSSAPFADCLVDPLARAAGPLVITGPLPLFTHCRNATCIARANEASGRGIASNKTTPVSSGARAIGELQPLAGTLAEVDCREHERSERAAVQLVEAAFRWSLPLVLRGCAVEMPAVRTWRRKVIDLRSTAGDKADAANLKHFGEAFTRDTRWAAPFGRKLESFAPSISSRTLWVSTGGQRGDAHYDTFDNLHAVVTGAKTFRLISPRDAPSLYYDFAHLRDPEANEQEEIVCPSKHSYGKLLTKNEPTVW